MVDAGLVRSLIKQQFPHYSHLAIRPVKNQGHDNRTFHLGDSLSVRLPSGKAYAPQVEKEFKWLPFLAEHISLSVSQPVGMGDPGCGFPFPWTINRWVKGETLTYENISNLSLLAKDLADFLKQLQAVDAREGPAAGAHNFYRGGALDTYDRETRVALEKLKSSFPIDRLILLWETALKSQWEREPLWVHGDVAVGNLLVKKHRLCGVIDFGTMGVGDPACDYVMAWTYFTKESRRIFWERLNCDDNTRERAMGWALWKALISFNPREPHSHMSLWAANTIEEILTDYD